MEKINGYPNNFWGWGGEDDEMNKRCETTKIKWVGVEEKGGIRDLEEMDIQEKVRTTTIDIEGRKRRSDSAFICIDPLLNRRFRSSAPPDDVPTRPQRMEMPHEKRSPSRTLLNLVHQRPLLVSLHRDLPLLR